MKKIRLLFFLCLPIYAFGDYRAEPQDSFYAQDLSVMRIWHTYVEAMMKEILLTDADLVKINNGYVESTRKNEIAAIKTMLKKWKAAKTSESQLSDYLLEQLEDLDNIGCLESYIEIYIKRNWWASKKVDICPLLSEKSFDESLIFPNHVKFKHIERKKGPEPL